MDFCHCNGLWQLRVFSIYLQYLYWSHVVTLHAINWCGFWCTVATPQWKLLKTEIDRSSNVALQVTARRRPTCSWCLSTYDTGPWTYIKLSDSLGMLWQMQTSILVRHIIKHDVRYSITRYLVSVSGISWDFVTCLLVPGTYYSTSHHHRSSSFSLFCGPDE